MKRIFTYGFLLLLVIPGCEINQKEILPEDGFLKIYNHPEETLAFYPESVTQLPGGGYLFVSAVKDEESDLEYPSTQLVRTTEAGVVEWSRIYDWLAPTSDLILRGSSVMFVAMDGQLNAYAIVVDPSSGDVREQHDLEMTMPLYAFSDRQGNLVVLGYDFVSRSSWISKFNGAYGLERSILLAVNTDLELMIQRHLNKTGEDFPFFIGEYSNDAGSGYYLSCFYNYTLRTVFLDISSLNHSGDIFSFQTDEAISSVIHRSGSLFGFTGYYEGNNYIVSETEVDVNASQSIKDFEADQLYELTYQAKVVATSISKDGAEYALFVSQTNANSIVIYQYTMDADSLINTIHRTFDQRVEVAGVIQTEDKGVAILAGIHLMGKYRRPVLFKELAELFFPEED
ncbi:MAG: hypothetical protein GY790_15380 [Bacteroidetes bacterium]|nr:hypothetical protein [Bacteroidota bacterium]